MAVWFVIVLAAVLIAAVASAQTDTPTATNTPTATPTFLACGTPPWVVTDEGDTQSTASLRWAIACADAYVADSDPQSIEFNIASPSGITVSGSTLTLTRAHTTIDGSTQSGTVAGDIHGGTEPSPVVQVGGAVTTGCLRLLGADTHLIGVRFNCDADTNTASLQISGNGSSVRASVIGNALADMGINASGDNVTIGGPNVGDGNVIKNVAVDGITAADCDGLTIEGNLIKDIGEDGIFLGGGTSTTNVTVGGASGRRNIITGCGFGNDHSGIAIWDGVATATINNNRIGVDWNGAADGNKWGISVVRDPSFVTSASGVTISSNLISASTNSGVYIGSGSTGASVTSNNVGTTVAGGDDPAYCNGLPQIDDQDSSTVSGNTVSTCAPTPTATPTSTPTPVLGCCVLPCNPAALPTQPPDDYCLDTDAGFGDVTEAFCQVVADTYCGGTVVRFVAGDTCVAGCAAPTDTPTPTPTASDTATATVTPTATPTDTPTVTPTVTPTPTATAAPGGHIVIGVPAKRRVEIVAPKDSAITIDPKRSTIEVPHP